MMSIILFFLACFDVVFVFAVIIGIIYGLITGIRNIMS